MLKIRDQAAMEVEMSMEAEMKVKTIKSKDWAMKTIVLMKMKKILIKISLLGVAP